MPSLETIRNKKKKERHKLLLEHRETQRRERAALQEPAMKQPVLTSFTGFLNNQQPFASATVNPSFDINEPEMKATSMKEPAMKEPAMKDHTMKDHAMKPMIIEAVSLKDLAKKPIPMKAASVKDPAIEATSVKDHAIEATSVKDHAIEATSVKDTRPGLTSFKRFLNNKNPIVSATVEEPAKPRMTTHELFKPMDSDSDDSTDSDMSVGSNSNSNSSKIRLQKDSTSPSASILTRAIIDRQLVKTKVKDFKTLKKAILDSKRDRQIYGLDSQENPDCSVCAFYVFSKLLESSPDNTTGFRAMQPDIFYKYSSYCRDNTCGGVSTNDVNNLFKNNGITNIGIRKFRVESENGIRVLLSELLEPGEATLLLLPYSNILPLGGHIVLVYANHSDGKHYIIDIQTQTPLQLTELADYNLSSNRNYANGGFIGLLVKEKKKINRAIKRVTSHSGKQHEKPFSVNSDVNEEFSNLMHEVEPSSPVAVRKPKRDESERPRKRSRTSGGNNKTRKTRK
jgi:hypothetical protein